MATREYSFSEWLKLVRKHALDREFANLSGYPVADVAAKLKVSEARVYQLLEADHLDMVRVMTKAGRVSISLVTEASVERYLDLRVPDRGRQGYFAFPETT